jgi:hypothetical protein
VPIGVMPESGRAAYAQKEKLINYAEGSDRDATSEDSQRSCQMALPIESTLSSVSVCLCLYLDNLDWPGRCSSFVAQRQGLPSHVVAGNGLAVEPQSLNEGIQADEGPERAPGLASVKLDVPVSDVGLMFGVS